MFFVSISHIPTFIIWVSSVKKTCPFSHLLIYSTLCLCQYGLLDIYIILGSWSNTVIIYFVAQTVPLWLFSSSIFEMTAVSASFLNKSFIKI